MKESNHGLHFSVDVEVCSFIGIEVAVKVKGYIQQPLSAAVCRFLQEKLAFKSQFLNSYWTGYHSGMRQYLRGAGNFKMSQNLLCSGACANVYRNQLTAPLSAQQQLVGDSVGYFMNLTGTFHLQYSNFTTGNRAELTNKRKCKKKKNPHHQHKKTTSINSKTIRPDIIYGISAQSLCVCSLQCAVTSLHPANSHFLVNSLLFSMESPACLLDSRSFVSWCV